MAVVAWRQLCVPGHALETSSNGFWRDVSVAMNECSAGRALPVDHQCYLYNYKTINVYLSFFCCC